MTEKRQIIDALRLNYNGVFDVVELYREIEDWIVKHGMEKEIKKKREHVKADGKNIEWFIEIWKSPTDYAKIIVRVKALMSNIKDVEIVKGDSKINLNHGNVTIIFDGFIEQDIKGRWQQKPLYYFIRSLYDKYVYKLWSNKFDKDVFNYCHSLHKVLDDFFKHYQT